MLIAQSRGLIGLWILFGITALMPPAVAREAKPHVEAEGPRPWYTLLRPARSKPQDQLAYARRLRANGRTWWARRHYRALVASWPTSPEAAVAQRELAELLAERGADEAAFEAYQQLMDRHAGLFPFDDVFRRQLAIAERALSRRMWRFLFGGFRTPERAIPLLEKVAANAPSREEGARAYLLLGRARQELKEHDEAIAAFERVMFSVPGHPMAVEAEWRRVESLWAKAKGAKSDRASLDEAWWALERFLKQKPESPFHGEATRLREELSRLRVEREWAQARFYDRRGTPEAARLAYERFLANFPQDARAEWARRRIAELKGTPEDSKP